MQSNSGVNGRTPKASPAPFVNRPQASTRNSPSRPTSSKPFSNRQYGGTGASAAGNRRFGALFPTTGHGREQGSAMSALFPANGNLHTDVPMRNDQPASMAVGSDVWAAHDLHFMDVDDYPAVNENRPAENGAAARQSAGNLANGHNAGAPVTCHSGAATSAGEQQDPEMTRQDRREANEATVHSLQQELADKNARIARLEAELLAVRRMHALIGWMHSHRFNAITLIAEPIGDHEPYG